MRPPPPTKREELLTPAVPRPLVPRICVHAVEGFGKTSLAAYAPAPYVLMGKGEAGYTTLLSAGLVPAVPAIEVTRWIDLLSLLNELANDPQGRKTLVLDTIGSFERLCHEYICAKEFKGDWGERGFTAYQRGYDIAASEWTGMLSSLDEVHRHGVTILLLAHSRVATYKNPLGADFDRFVPDLHTKTWAPTHRWCDAVLFGNFFTVIDDEKRAKRTGRGTGIGGTDRILYTEHRDGYDAKNRFGMEPELWMDGGPSAAWPALWSAIVRKDKKNVI